MKKKFLIKSDKKKLLKKLLLERKVFNFKLNKFTNKFINTSNLIKLRKNIARIKTFLRNLKCQEKS